MKRNRPKIKGQLESYEQSLQHIQDDEVIEYTYIKGNTLSEISDIRVVFDTVIFEQVTFQHVTLERSEFIDCVFQQCDFSGTQFTSGIFIRCEFIGCKMIGSHFVETNIKDVLFKDCTNDFIDLANSKLTSVEIEKTSMIDCNIFQCEVKDLQLNEVDFTNGYFYETPFLNVDFSGSILVDLKTDLGSIKGAIIAAHQAVDLIHLLGLKIK